MKMEAYYWISNKNERQRKLKGQSRNDNPQTLATLGTQDTE